MNENESQNKYHELVQVLDEIETMLDIRKRHYGRCRFIAKGRPEPTKAEMIMASMLGKIHHLIHTFNPSNSCYNDHEIWRNQIKDELDGRKAVGLAANVKSQSIV